MGKDIFEDVKMLVGCQYISDIPYMKRKVLKILNKVDFSLYPAEKVKEFMCYLYSRES